jgi:hypothetical protein
MGQTLLDSLVVELPVVFVERNIFDNPVGRKITHDAHDFLGIV